MVTVTAPAVKSTLFFDFVNVLLRDSSAVEHATVNRGVLGSIPSLGAKHLPDAKESPKGGVVIVDLGDVVWRSCLCFSFPQQVWVTTAIRALPNIPCYSCSSGLDSTVSEFDLHSGVPEL